jgi:hypothetical protein
MLVLKQLFAFLNYAFHLIFDILATVLATFARIWLFFQSSGHTAGDKYSSLFVGITIGEEKSFITLAKIENFINCY